MKFEDIDYSKYDFQNMSDEEFASVPPEIKRSCYDCRFCQVALSYWCRNKEAIKARGTSIPGCIKCPYWEGDITTVNIVDHVKSFFRKFV